jgi:quercetin dioxygenase-like cupin family protein
LSHGYGTCSLGLPGRDRTAEINMDLETFKTQLQQAGYSEVVEKSYAPDTSIDVHTHPFAARALITSGEMSITCGDEARTYRVGEIFELDANRPHAEHYGPAGASYLVGRRHGGAA